MTTFRYGPVEFYAIGFEGDRPGAGVLKAIDDLVESKTVNLIDLVFARPSVDGDGKWTYEQAWRHHVPLRRTAVHTSAEPATATRRNSRPQAASDDGLRR